MKVKVTIINPAVTVPRLVMMTSIVSEESLARDTHTHTQTRTHTLAHTDTHTYTSSHGHAHIH